MRIFQFAKWWWDKNDVFTRTVVCFGIFWALPCGIAGIWFGNTAITVLISGLGVVIGTFILYWVFQMFKKMWDEFNDSYPTEDVAIVRKLKGIPTPSKEHDAVYYD